MANPLSAAETTRVDDDLYRSIPALGKAHGIANPGIVQRIVDLEETPTDAALVAALKTAFAATAVAAVTTTAAVTAVADAETQGATYDQADVQTIADLVNDLKAKYNAAVTEIAEVKALLNDIRTKYNASANGVDSL